MASMPLSSLWPRSARRFGRFCADARVLKAFDRGKHKKSDIEQELKKFRKEDYARFAVALLIISQRIDSRV
jgi:hypothetical protein